MEFDKWKFITSLQSETALNEAKIAELQAKAYQLIEQGKAEPEKNRINAYNAAVQALREQNQHAREQMKLFLERMNSERTNGAGPRAVSGLEGSPDDQVPDAMGLSTT
jgi:hypothetical protein